MSPDEKFERLMQADLVLENNTQYRIGDETMRFMWDWLRPGHRTLETGIGYTTLMFAAKGTRHTVCFTEAPVQNNVEGYAKQFDIDLSVVEFCLGRSEDTLPRMGPKPLSFVLIDGRHAFPTAMIDWYYTASRLRCRGVLVIDDLHIWSVRVLFEFLQMEPEWRLLGLFDGRRAASFMKVGEATVDKWWGEQPINHDRYVMDVRENLLWGREVPLL